MKKLTLLLALLIYLAAGPALYAQQLTIQADAGKQVLSRTDIEGLPHVKVTASEHSSGPVGFEGVTLKIILEKCRHLLRRILEGEATEQLFTS